MVHKINKMKEEIESGFEWYNMQNDRFFLWRCSYSEAFGCQYAATGHCDKNCACQDI